MPSTCLGGCRLEPTFDANTFMENLGRGLIREFEEARQATTGPLIGAAIETPVRKRLEQVLPRGIAVDSGCVIDSYGNCSRQQDVVLYERDNCPVFSVNNTPESTYYPCEGVLGVIEVKSSITSNRLRDSFEKISSVRNLNRYNIMEPVGARGESRPKYRRYHSTQMATEISLVEPKDLEPRGLHQIFGAVLGGHLELRANTFGDRFAALVSEFGIDDSPNMVAILDSGALIPCSMMTGENSAQFSAKAATHFMFTDSAPLRVLIGRVYMTYRHGVTSPTEVFSRYIAGVEDGYNSMWVTEINRADHG